MAPFLNGRWQGSRKVEARNLGPFPRHKVHPQPTPPPLGPYMLGDWETGLGPLHPHCGHPFPPSERTGLIFSVLQCTRLQTTSALGYFSHQQSSFNPGDRTNATRSPFTDEEADVREPPEPPAQPAPGPMAKAWQGGWPGRHTGAAQRGRRSFGKRRKLTRPPPPLQGDPRGSSHACPRSGASPLLHSFPGVLALGPRCQPV